ncbi:MAG: ATP-binding protein [Minisyncoccales bacterium]
MTPLWEIILVSIITLLSLFLGFLVYFKDRKRNVNCYFLFICIFTTLFIGSAYLSEFFPLTNPSLAILLTKITYGAVLWWIIFLFLFSLSFPEERKISSKISLTLFSLGALLTILILFTSLMVKKIVIQPWGFDVVYGKLFLPFFGTFFLVLVGLFFFNIFKRYKKAGNIEKQQFKYFFLGLGIFIGSILFFNSFLPFIIGSQQYYRLGNYSSIFFLAFTAYAIVKKQLFDIKVILTEILVCFIVLLLIIQTITAPQLSFKILNGAIFILFCLFGYYLIKATLREISLRQEVERLSKAKSEFISIASHQLRTPLTAIKGYISMILEGTYGPLPGKMQKPMENVYASNERLIKLVNDLLNISRLEAGRIEFKWEPISIGELIENIVSELKINAEKKGLYLKIVKPKEKLPPITADKDKLRQVILNLIDNAIKYTQQGGITIKLKIENLKLKIAVADTGEGMTQEEINKLFEMFSRASAGTELNVSGTGIGLYVAKKFAEAHGGRIWVESTGKDKGSTFIVELPIK